MSDLVQTTFDYSSYEPKDVARLETISTIMYADAQAIGDILERHADFLIEAQEIHKRKPGQSGDFVAWVDSKTPYDHPTVYRLMNARRNLGPEMYRAAQFGKRKLLLIGNAPEEIRSELLEKADTSTTREIEAEIKKTRAAEREAAQAKQQLADQQEEYAAAQGRATALRQTIADLQRQLEQAKPQDKIVPDPKQAKQIKELERKLAKAEQEKEAAKKHAQELQAQVEVDAPEKLIRDECRINVDRAANLLRNVSGLLPIPRNAYAFTASEWQAIDSLERMAQQTLANIQELRTSPQIVDALAR
jgi:hypothetical protein